MFPELIFVSFDSWESQLPNDAKIIIWGVYHAELWIDDTKCVKTHQIIKWELWIKHQILRRSLARLVYFSSIFPFCFFFLSRKTQFLMFFILCHISEIKWWLTQKYKNGDTKFDDRHYMCGCLGWRLVDQAEIFPSSTKSVQRRPRRRCLGRFVSIIKRKL